MRERNRGRSISNLAALLTFCVFAVGILSVLLSGANAYRRLTERDSLSYNSRTCAQYLASKVRQAPEPDCILLSEFGDGDALVITNEVDGEVYLTRVYCYDGWLMELFSLADGDFAPEDGEKVLHAESLEITEEAGLFRVTITDGDGITTEQLLSLRGGEGAAS